MNLTDGMMLRREQQHNASGKNEARMEWEKNGEENNISHNWTWKSILTKKGWTELLEESTTKEYASSGLMENISKLWVENLPLTEKNWLLESNPEMKSFFHREDKEKLGSLISTTNSNNP